MRFVQKSYFPIIVLAVVLMTSVLQYHRHDCQGHISFSHNVECSYTHSGGDKSSNSDGECALHFDSQISEQNKLCIAPIQSLLTGLVHEPNKDLLLVDMRLFNRDYEISPKLLDKKSGLQLSLRAPPVHLN